MVSRRKALPAVVGMRLTAFRTSNGAPAESDATVSLASGVLESSNVNVADAMVQMIELARRFDLQVKAMKNTDENAQITAKLLGLS